MTERFENASTLIELEPTGIVVWTHKAPATVEEARAAIRFLSDKAGHLKHVVTIVDFKDSSAPSADVRKAIAEESKGSTNGVGTAFVGASFAMRTVGKMLMTVMNAAAGRDSPAAFFDDMAAARAWAKERLDALAAAP